MTVTLELEPDLDSRIRELADAKGLTVEGLLTDVIREALPPDRNRAAVERLRSWIEEDATEDREELAAREQDWEETKAALNEGHTSDRVLFP